MLIKKPVAQVQGAILEITLQSWQCYARGMYSTRLLAGVRHPRPIIDTERLFGTPRLRVCIHMRTIILESKFTPLYLSRRRPQTAAKKDAPSLQQHADT